MPSSKVKRAESYPMHWVDAMRYLALTQDGTEIVLAEGLTAAQVNTKHTAARAMKLSIRAGKGWIPVVFDMVRKDRLAFRQEERMWGWALIAYNREERRSIEELLARVNK